MPLGVIGIHFETTLRSLRPHFSFFVSFRIVVVWGFFVKKKRAMKRPNCELDPIFVGPNGGFKKNTFVPQKRDLDIVCIFATLKPFSFGFFVFYEQARHEASQL